MTLSSKNWLKFTKWNVNARRVYSFFLFFLFLFLILIKYSTHNIIGLPLAMCWTWSIKKHQCFWLYFTITRIKLFNFLGSNILRTPTKQSILNTMVYYYSSTKHKKKVRILLSDLEMYVVIGQWPHKQVNNINIIKALRAHSILSFSFSLSFLHHNP